MGDIVSKEPPRFLEAPRNPIVVFGNHYITNGQVKLYMKGEEIYTNDRQILFRLTKGRLKGFSRLKMFSDARRGPLCYFDNRGIYRDEYGQVMWSHVTKQNPIFQTMGCVFHYSPAKPKQNYMLMNGSTVAQGTNLSVNELIFHFVVAPNVDLALASLLFRLAVVLMLEEVTSIAAKALGGFGG